MSAPEWRPPLRSYEHYVWLLTGLRVRITWDTRDLLRPS